MRSGLRLVFLTIMALGCLNAEGQTVASIHKEANNFYEHSQFRAALQYFRQSGNEQTWDKKTKLRVAVCMYEVNDIDGSLSLLNQLVEEGKTEAYVFYYLARGYQHKLQFERAVSNYKEYLRRAKKDDPLQDWVKDEILRCASGKSTKFAEQKAFVENLGTSINTLYDEYSPVPSPIYHDRLYFTSSRSGSKGGLYDPKGEDDLKYGRYRSDIYFSEYQNGVWKSAEQMGDALNTVRNEELMTFSNDGQRMFLLTGNRQNSSDLVIDTFSVYREGPMKASSIGDFDPLAGDRDLHVFNDSVILFASNRPGGIGGYDLYYCLRKNGTWMKAVNLGDDINSFYDEVSPFLTRNGRHLYFASSRLTSMGGLDVFESVFDDGDGLWSIPSNLGVPVNSAGDDAYFRLSSDGMTAFLSSDRKDGYGERDIYAVYLKTLVQEHLSLSVPITFAHVAIPDAGDGSDTKERVAKSREERKEYFISDLQFDANDVVITPQNIKKLDVLANLMLIYPSITCDLICHDIPGDTRSFDLYFSIKKAEQAAEYLGRKGVDASRLMTKGCGSFYPLAVNPDPAQPNPSINRLNRRIEVKVYNTEDLPIDIIYAYPNVATELANPQAAEFSRLQGGLLYRVQIASVNQMLQNSIFERVENAMVFLDPSTKRYLYTVGMETDHDSALEIRNFVRKNGFGDAFITAYYKGQKLDRVQIVNMSEEYPEVIKVLERD